VQFKNSNSTAQSKGSFTGVAVLHGAAPQRNACGVNDFEFDRTCNGTCYQQSKKTGQSTRIPLHARKFGELWSRNGWERLRVFAHPEIFALGDTACLTAWTLYNRQQANFGTCYVVTRAYSLQQQNAGWAHAGLCSASKKGKGFPYSLPSVGPGADPAVQAVSPQVTISHPPGGRLPCLRLPPQPQSITSPWPVPSYTAWW